MIGEILDAVIKECRTFIDANPDYAKATVIHKTDFKTANLETYGMPLLLLDVPDAVDTGMYCGGVSHADWQFLFGSYNYQPDAYTDDQTGYSTNLLNIIDQVRQHFSFGAPWLTQGMYDVQTNYGFRFTLSGILPADALEGDGLVVGYKMIFDSIAIDMTTDAVISSTAVLEHAVQLGYPPTT